MVLRLHTATFLVMLACNVPGVAVAQPKLPKLQTVADWNCQPVDAGIAEALETFDQDAGYSVTGTKDADGKRVRIGGDTLILDSKNLPFVISEISKAFPGVRQIVFDARRIIIGGPISLRNGELVFLADQVDFSKNARITFTGPIVQSTEGIRIVARKVVFDPQLKKPLQMIPATGDADRKRRIEIVADTVMHGDRVVRPYDAEKYLWQRTLGSYTSSTLPSKALWATKLGADSTEPYMAQFRDEMRWPQFFLTKLLKFHSRNPYDPANQEELVSNTKQYLPLLEKWSDSQVSLEMHRLLTRISANVDLLGYGPNYAPRVKLKEQRDAVQTQLDGLRDGSKTKSYFDLLTDLVLATYDRKPPSDKEVASLKERVQSAEDALQGFDAEFAALTNKSRELAAKFPPIKQAIEETKKRIERSTRDEIKRYRDAVAAKQGFALAGTAAAIIAAPYVAPEAAAAIGAAGSLTGDLVYQHNVGGQTGLTVLEAVSNASQFYGSMGKLFESWDSYQGSRKTLKQVLNGEIVKDDPEPAEGEPDTRKPLTKSQASGRAAAAAGVLLSSFYDLLKSTAPPTSAPLTLEEKEQLDPRMAELIAQLSALSSEQSDVLDKMKSAIERRALASDSLQRERELLDTLLALDPGNDREITRWHANALALWQNATQRLARDAIVLRRAFQYETGQPVSLKADVLQFADEMLAATRAGTYDPLATTADDKDTLDKHLASQRTQFAAAISALLAEVDTGLRLHLSRGTLLRAHRTAYEFRVGGRDLASQRFIEALNAQIAVQIAGQMDARRVMPMLIPVRWKPSISKLPERLVDARVLKVEFEQELDSIGDSGLAFHIVHPFYGAMYRDGACSVFDMRDTTALQNTLEFVTDIGAVNLGWLKEQPGVVDISALDSYYARPPLRTDYRMLVQVTSDRWYSLPKIKAITIGLEVLQ